MAVRAVAVRAARSAAWAPRRWVWSANHPHAEPKQQQTPVRKRRRMVSVGRRPQQHRAAAPVDPDDVPDLSGVHPALRRAQHQRAAAPVDPDDAPGLGGVHPALRSRPAQQPQAATPEPAAERAQPSARRPVRRQSKAEPQEEEDEGEEDEDGEEGEEEDDTSADDAAAVRGVVREVRMEAAEGVGEGGRAPQLTVLPLDDDDKDMLDHRHQATFLPNSFAPEQRASLTRLFKTAGVSTDWTDFVLLNHLSTREWCLQTDQYCYLGRTAVREMLTEAVLYFTCRHGLPWVRQCAPVTFEVDASSPWPVSPMFKGAHGLPSNYDPAVHGRPPDVGTELSSLHVEQLLAVLLNPAWLRMLARDNGLHALQDSEQLPTLTDYSEEEMRNPAMLLRPARRRFGPNPSRTNFRPSGSLSRAKSPLPAKLLGLVGAVHIEKGHAAAQAVAREVWGLGTTSSDLVERAIWALDRQIMEGSPSEVVAALLQEQKIQFDWKVHSVELPADAGRVTDDSHHGRLPDPSAAVVGDDAATDTGKFTESASTISSADEALREAKEAREREDGGEQEEVRPALVSDGEDKGAVPATFAGGDDEYTLQFDANGNPIDLRQTSELSPVPMGPYQSEFPISDAPIFAPPSPDAPIVERLHWKRTVREEKARNQDKLRSLFDALLTPRQLSFKAVLQCRRTGAVIGSGAGSSVASARVSAQSDYIRRLRANLAGLQRAVQDVESSPVGKAASAA
eukprot:TRINITY_DN7308_c0_g1_i1.p1 TRINITY_DN7308_c0_g1~~TRINITY_DN7308_c0_g1_i1.p1  ORF type:complete len:736 (+),score=271.29 TRINITY_DN7308_c0_g1_i1:73-2280(+)